MLDGWWQGKRAGSGTIVWESRRLLAEGKIDYDEFMERAYRIRPQRPAPVATPWLPTMNAMAEALGIS